LATEVTSASRIAKPATEPRETSSRIPRPGAGMTTAPGEGRATAGRMVVLTVGIRRRQRHWRAPQVTVSNGRHQGCRRSAAAILSPV
jgi:hypothetical protein